MFHGRFSPTVWNHGKSIKKVKRTHNPFFLFQHKRLGEVKDVQLFDVLIHSMTVKGRLMGYIFLNFPHCPQRLIAVVT